MTNAELIAALQTDIREVEDDPVKTLSLMWRAADALEAQQKALDECAKQLAEMAAQLPKEGEWIMDEHPHDGDCRCSVCLVAIGAMHERNHGLLNALTGGKWWRFYRYCPECGSRMRKGEQE